MNVQPPLPPTYGRAPGRPKKQRRKSTDEVQEMKDKRVKVRRVGQICKCTYCGEKGHNTRTCKLRQQKCGDEDVSLSQMSSAGLHEAQCETNLSQMDTNHSIFVSDKI